MLIGNADAHGKNYSMIYRGGERRLAPLYDLVATIAWPELSTRPAMSIGSGKSINDVNPSHFRGMAEEAALGWPMVRERIATLAGQVVGILGEGHLVQASPATGVAAQLSGLVTERCQRMLSQLKAKARRTRPSFGAWTR